MIYRGCKSVVKFRNLVLDSFVFSKFITCAVGGEVSWFPGARQVVKISLIFFCEVKEASAAAIFLGISSFWPN